MCLQKFYEQESTVCVNKIFLYLHVPVDCTRTGCVYTSHLYNIRLNYYLYTIAAEVTIVKDRVGPLVRLPNG